MGKEKTILSDSLDLFSPATLIDNDKIILIFTKYSSIDDNYKIYETECEKDYLNCTTPNLILSPSQNSWDRKGVVSGSIFKENGVYYLTFSGWEGHIWNISLAASSDGKNWNKCGEGYFISSNADAPHLYKIDTKYYIYFHDPFATGIKSIETQNLSCSSTWSSPTTVLTKGNSYDSTHIIFPTLSKVGERYFLYYTGRDTSGNWTLDFATTEEPPTPLIIIPGMFASWNKEAILHNDTNSTDWKLLSFVKEYNGLIETLKNLNYSENKDFYLFAYDWRKKVTDSESDLDNFLNSIYFNTFPDGKVKIIGHSLGGLIGRIYTQDHIEKVKKLVTVGSPHQGAIQIYKPLEAGEIERQNTLVWLAEKIILVLNKSSIESDRETMRRILPVGFDLLPTFDFLKKGDGTLIPNSTLSITNSTLPSYNNNISQISTISTFIYSNKSTSTPEFYRVADPSDIDKLLGNYADGKPIEETKGEGDTTVLTKSTAFSTIESVNAGEYTHGEIIYKKGPLKTILEKLGITANEDKIVEGQGTTISPSLVFLAQSPVTMSVDYGNKIYQEDEGIILISSASAGVYNLRLSKTGTGDYTIHVGKITETKDEWDTIKGNTTEFNSSTNDKQYTIYFQVTPTPTPTPTLTLTPTPTLSPTNTPTLVPTSTSTSTSTSSSTKSSTTESSSETSSSQDTPFNPPKKAYLASDKTHSYLSQITTIIPEQGKSKPQVLGKESKRSRSSKSPTNHSFSRRILTLLLLIVIIVGSSLLFYKRNRKA